jgi:hypothetical protein
MPQLRMLIHFPSFLTFSNSSEEQNTSPKWTSDGDSTTFTSKKEMNRKLSFSPLMDYSNPPSCSSACAIHQQLSKP